MVTFIIATIVIIALVLWFKFKIAKHKKPEERSAIESMLVTQGVKNRKSLEEAAGAMRTAEISRDEAMQKTKDAITQLDSDFKTELKNLLLNQSKLSAKLPQMKLIPGKKEGAARNSKKKMEEALAKGRQEVANEYKKNAIMYLDQKNRALERIKRAEKSLEDLEINIDLAQATYEGRKSQLDDILQELESMHSAISTAKFRANMEMIESLRCETVNKLTEQNAEIEAQNRISGIEDSGRNSINSADYEDEFNNL